MPGEEPIWVAMFWCGLGSRARAGHGALQNSHDSQVPLDLEGSKCIIFIHNVLHGLSQTQELAMRIAKEVAQKEHAGREDLFLEDVEKRTRIV